MGVRAVKKQIVKMKLLQKMVPFHFIISFMNLRHNNNNIFVRHSQPTFPCSEFNIFHKLKISIPSRMEYLLDAELFDRYYNCSFYDYNSIPRQARQHLIAGACLLVLYVVFEVKVSQKIMQIIQNFMNISPSTGTLSAMPGRLWPVPESTDVLLQVDAGHGRVQVGNSS
jgi:hypothetical protein